MARATCAYMLSSLLSHVGVAVVRLHLVLQPAVSRPHQRGDESADPQVAAHWEWCEKTFLPSLQRHSPGPHRQRRKSKEEDRTHNYDHTLCSVSALKPYLFTWKHFRLSPVQDQGSFRELATRVRAPLTLTGV